MPLNARLRSSILLQPHDHGTRVTVRSAKATAGNVLSRAAMRLVSKLFVSRARQGWTQSLAKLEETKE